MSDVHYQSLDAEKQAKSSKRSKLIVSLNLNFSFLVYFRISPKVIGSLVGLIVLIAIGVTVGVVVSKNSSKDKATSSTGSSNSSSTGGGSNATNSNDPSVFTKDERLHRSFYGMAYTPEGSLPDYGCNSTLGMRILLLHIPRPCIKAYIPFPSRCHQGYPGAFSP
jgi:hypothetical protein